MIAVCRWLAERRLSMIEVAGGASVGTLAVVNNDAIGAFIAFVVTVLAQVVVASVGETYE